MLELLLIIIVLGVVFGGFGYYRGGWAGPGPGPGYGGGNLLWIVIVVIVLLAVFGGGFGYYHGGLGRW